MTDDLFGGPAPQRKTPPPKGKPARTMWDQMPRPGDGDTTPQKLTFGVGQRVRRGERLVVGLHDQFGLDLPKRRRHVEFADEAAAKRRKERQAAYLASLSQEEREALEKAEALERAGVPFVFATGGSDDSVDERFRDRPVLQKPFTMDGVAKALASL